MRNRLIHAYFDIDTDILCTTVSRDAPALSVRVNAILGETDVP
jgi:uncharacterized protein with HEPN domain